MASLVLQLPLECRFQLDSNIPTIATETPPTKIFAASTFFCFFDSKKNYFVLFYEGRILFHNDAIVANVPNC